ncbi:hypothetical protein ACIRP3_43760 [Streptomyces sp. NPDC101209]|uniref:hypothetical protein n=1 Tax=Streptomyces sp. NPDC101209 TaxID=3366129 RepID=UPI00380356DC
MLDGLRSRWTIPRWWADSRARLIWIAQVKAAWVTGSGRPVSVFSGPPTRSVAIFVALRNKVEHRYEDNLKIVTGGKAQALVMNYEQERVAHFGPA